MLDCINTEYRRVSGVLNLVYRQLLGTAGVDKGKLAAAESRWIAFRDADCKFAGSLNADGSLQQVDVGTCLVDQTTARVKQLQTYLKQATQGRALSRAAANSVDVLKTFRTKLASVKRKTSVLVLLPASLPFAGKVPKLKGVTCGASCSPATLWFTHRGVLYTWQHADPPKNAKAVLGRLAAQAIEAGPR